MLWRFMDCVAAEVEMDTASEQRRIWAAEVLRQEKGQVNSLTKPSLSDRMNAILT